MDSNEEGVMYVLYVFLQGERATGYGVALLSAMFAEYSNNSIIRAMSPFKPDNPDESDKKRIKTAV